MVRVDGSGNSQGLIRARGLNKTYSRGGEKIQVLQRLNLDVDKGDFVAFMGPSGSGKTTLLNLLGGLDVPTHGSITVAGDEITHMSASKLTQWRARHVGFIFQMYNLIPVLTAFQNVELPLLLTKLSKADRRKHVETALGVVGLAERMHHYPRQLSGGQEQRVAIARADRLVIINRISIIQPLPLAYRDKMLRIPGVKAVTHNNWFGGVYQDEKNFFPQFAIDVENQRTVLPELVVPDDQWANFVKDRTGAIAGAKTAKRFGWKVGDRIPIKNALFGAANVWEFTLDGIYHSEKAGGDESQFWFQWDFFEERMPQSFKGNVGWYVLRLDNPDDAPR